MAEVAEVVLVVVVMVRAAAAAAVEVEERAVRLDPVPMTTVADHQPGTTGCPHSVGIGVITAPALPRYRSCCRHRGSRLQTAGLGRS